MSVRNVVSVILVALAAVFVLASCTQNTGTKNEYMQITQEEAKNIMEGYVGECVIH